MYAFPVSILIRFCFFKTPLRRRNFPGTVKTDLLVVKATLSTYPSKQHSKSVCLGNFGGMSPPLRVPLQECSIIAGM